MKLVPTLVEIVNTVADWPQYRVRLMDDPRSMTAGFRVGNLSWALGIRDIKKGLPEVDAVYEKLVKIRETVRPLPLRPYPLDQRAREVHVRCALLNCARQMTTLDQREHVAWWATFLGRLQSWGGKPFPDDAQSPKAVIVHDSIGMPLSRQELEDF